MAHGARTSDYLPLPARFVASDDRRAMAERRRVAAVQGAYIFPPSQPALGMSGPVRGTPTLLGGDHPISYPVIRAVRWSHARLSVLHFDAHPDLYPEFEGDPYSHACPFSRVMEERLADQLVQVGIRAMTAAQRAQAERYGVEVIDMDAWVAGRRPALRHPVYVSIDVDAFDPAFAPGVSHREPGGLTVREVLTVLHGLSVPLVGADIVEFNPAQDASGMTATLCAKLVKEVAGKMT